MGLLQWFLKEIQNKSSLSKQYPQCVVKAIFPFFFLRAYQVMVMIKAFNQSENVALTMLDLTVSYNKSQVHLRSYLSFLLWKPELNSKG